MIAHGAGSGSDQASTSKVAPELVEAMKKVYTLQFAGLADNGVGPRHPIEDPQANRCLTSLGPDGLQPDSIGLGFSSCPHYGGANSSGHPGTESVRKPSWEQLFQLDEDGTLYHCGTGLCLHLATCGASGEDSLVYDLGHCGDQHSTARFHVERSRAGRSDLTIPLGSPLQAAAKSCDGSGVCGPYLLQQVCRGAAQGEGCGLVPPPPDPGWTNNGTHGPAQRTSQRSFLQPVPMAVSACNTNVAPHGGRAFWDEVVNGDTPDHVAWWYFHRYGDHPAYEDPGYDGQ